MSRQKDLEKALDECLSAADPLMATALYPELEAELLPLIQTAQLVRETPRAVPDPATKAATLDRLLAMPAFKRQSRQAPQEDDGSPPKPSSFPFTTPLW